MKFVWIAMKTNGHFIHIEYNIGGGGGCLDGAMSDL